jgi:hypothetical protein
MFSVGADPRLYNEDYRPARIRIERVGSQIELGESLEMVVKGD